MHSIEERKTISIFLFLEKLLSMIISEENRKFDSEGVDFHVTLYIFLLLYFYFL